MNFKVLEGAYAGRIGYGTIHSCPSKEEAVLLRDRLAALGLVSECWPVDGDGCATSECSQKENTDQE